MEYGILSIIEHIHQGAVKVDKFSPENQELDCAYKTFNLTY